MEHWSSRELARCSLPVADIWRLRAQYLATEVISLHCIFGIFSLPREAPVTIIVFAMLYEAGLFPRTSLNSEKLFDEVQSHRLGKCGDFEMNSVADLDVLASNR